MNYSQLQLNWQTWNVIVKKRKTVGFVSLVQYPYSIWKTVSTKSMLPPYTKCSRNDFFTIYHHMVIQNINSKTSNL